VVIEHNMEVVMSLCQRIVVLSQGEKIAEGRAVGDTRRSSRHGRLLRDVALVMPLLEIRDLHAGYGRMEILKGVTLAVEPGQIASMGRALLLRPKLVLLDEPTLGLAPLVFKEIFRIIKELRQHGQTILMVEQNAAQALEISDYAYVLELGQNRYEGTGRAILTDPRVKRLYLGR
jgi:branched-chain amino acid transport system ATP-binding protein